MSCRWYPACIFTCTHTAHQHYTYYLTRTHSLPHSSSSSSPPHSLNKIRNTWQQRWGCSWVLRVLVLKVLPIVRHEHSQGTGEYQGRVHAYKKQVSCTCVQKAHVHTESSSSLFLVCASFTMQSVCGVAFLLLCMGCLSQCSPLCLLQAPV